MAFLKDLGKKLSDAGQSVSQKTKELADIIKLKNEMTDLENELEEVFTAIGKKVYELSPEAPNDEIAGLYAKIVSNKEKIEENKIKIREIKGLVICTKCGKEVDFRENQFCPACGTKIEVPYSEETEEAAEAQEEAGEEQAVIGEPKYEIDDPQDEDEKPE